jgi:hypothetical protein
VGDAMKRKEPSKKERDAEQAARRDEEWKYKFLKLSENYKALCALVRRSNLRRPYTARAIADLYPMGRGYIESTRTESKLPIKIIYTYLQYGDIHQPGHTFSTYWRETKKARQALKGHPVHELVTDYLDWLPVYFDMAQDAQDLLNIKDLKDSLLFVHRAFLSRSILVIDRLEYSQREENIICKQIKSIIHANTKNRNFPIDTIKFYYDAYRLRVKEEKKLKKIFEETRAPKKKGYYTGPYAKETRIYKDIQEAEACIKRIEQGIWPWWKLEKTMPDSAAKVGILQRKKKASKLKSQKELLP